MSFGFFKLCKTELNGTIEEANHLINQILNELYKAYPTSYHQLNRLINNRKNAFINQIYSRDIEYNKQQYIEAYVHFAQSLKDFLNKPDNINTQLDRYHESYSYCHVGGIDNDRSYTIFDMVANYALALGLGLFFLSLIAMSFSFPISLMLIGISASIIAPSLFYLLAITRPNALAIKEEEIELFIEAQRLVNPDAVVELTNEANFEDTYSC